MGTSISSMEARIPRCQLTCPFKLVWISAISRPFMVDNFNNIDLKHRSIILIENIDRLNVWARLGGLFAVWICGEYFRWIIFGLNLWCIFSTNVFWPENVWQTFCCAYVLSLLSWLVFLPVEISGFDGIRGSNRNSKHPMYPDCNWR